MGVEGERGALLRSEDTTLDIAGQGPTVHAVGGVGVV